jgi:23S rRNA (uracil1939-C5)-methyltransferase
LLAGEPAVSDRADVLLGPDAPVPADVQWVRTGASFFQGNRFLVGRLVREVLAAVRGPRVIDLYAGVGLFAVALAASGLSVTAVEGDPISGADLERNTARWSARMRARRTSVEYAAARMTTGEADTIVLDPPRTGMSPEALSAVTRLVAPRLVYVSCDPATLARDTKVLRASGYALGSLQGFDLFPNTPHIETLAVFDHERA